MSEKRLFQEYKQLRRVAASENNPQIIDLSPVDPETSIYKWTATIAKRNKHDSLFYYNGQWKLDIEVGTHYPRKPPKVLFSKKSKINHPNINLETGEICLDILKDDAWSPAWNLEHLVGAILMLIDEPEPDSPLNVDLANLFRSDKLAFESAVQHTMWKHKTFYQMPKLGLGIKGDGESASKQKQEKHDKDGKPKKPLKSEEPKKPLKSEEPKLSLQVSIGSEGDLEYIHDIGRHITEEFLKKATEVQIATPQNSQHQSSPRELEAVHQHVSNNVAKQIEQICLRQTSRAHSPTEETLEKKSDIRSAKENFLEKIDQQVEEIRRLQERQSLV